ncbi:MAG: hypothetical protein AB1861_18465 [Cyanobacteriota bacterium]
MLSILQQAKKLISVCLVTLLLVTSTLTIFPAPAKAEVYQQSIDESTIKEIVEPANAGVENIVQNEDVLAIGAIAAASSAAAGLGSITVATVTSAAPGILGWVGLATTTTVALPVAGIVAASGLVGYGIYKGVKLATEQETEQK